MNNVLDINKYPEILTKLTETTINIDYINVEDLPKIYQNVSLEKLRKSFKKWIEISLKNFRKDEFIYSHFNKDEINRNYHIHSKMQSIDTFWYLIWIEENPPDRKSYTNQQFRWECCNY